MSTSLAALDGPALEAARRALVQTHGEWTAHNLRLREQVYTFRADHPNFERQLQRHALHLRRILQIIADGSKKPLAELRVLDLACLEGLYGIELGLHGAEVVGIEGRRASVEKARFAAEALGLERVRIEEDDVRNFSVARHGEFDVILCLGILYHLDAPAVFRLVEQMGAACRGLVLIDTHVGLRGEHAYWHQGRRYEGWTYREHAPGTTPAERMKRAWASLDNETSFWISRSSLYNLLMDVGFTSAGSVAVPMVAAGSHSDRETFVAYKGQRVALASAPTTNGLPLQRCAEALEGRPHPSQDTRQERALRALSWLRREL
jgi:hypothetical protein